MILFTLAYRTAVMFVVMLVTMRILGKRQMGELELNELVVAIMLSELAVSPISNPEHRLLYGIVPVFVLLSGELLIAFLCMKSVRIRSLVIGKPSIIIQNGKIVQSEMRKNRLTFTELSENLRIQGVTDLSSIKYAVLEVNGSLSVLPFAAHTPATFAAHQLESEDKGLPVLIISDGRLLEENLTRIGLNRGWLEKELRKRGAKYHEQVFIFTVDENRNIYFAAKN